MFSKELKNIPFQNSIAAILCFRSFLAKLEWFIFLVLNGLICLLGIEAFSPTLCNIHLYVWIQRNINTCMNVWMHAQSKQRSNKLVVIVRSKSIDQCSFKGKNFYNYNIFKQRTKQEYLFDVRIFLQNNQALLTSSIGLSPHWVQHYGKIIYFLPSWVRVDHSIWFDQWNMSGNMTWAIPELKL